MKFNIKTEFNNISNKLIYNLHNFKVKLYLKYII